MKAVSFRGPGQECEWHPDVGQALSWGSKVVSPRWDDSDEAQTALRTIISDPAYGVAALSSSQTMANLLKDLLPDAPREASILVAAAEAGVAGNLRDHVSHGMDVGTASQVVAGDFAARTSLRPEACSWAVSEMAGALGLGSGGTGVPSGSSLPGGAGPTISPTPGAVPGGYRQGGFPPGGQVLPPGAYPYPPPPLGNAPGGYGPQPPPVYGPPQRPPFVPVAGTNGLAVASLVLGIVWLFWVGSLVGLIFGLVALRQIKRRNQDGRGLAIAGVVLSIIWLVVLLLLLIIGAVNGS
jgi:hypothetical protein